jgi:predicted HicB family RNase H-like nuclease
MPQKTATLNLRVTPEIKELARLAAAKEHRTVANLIEVLIRDYCNRNSLPAAAVDKQATSC